MGDSSAGGEVVPQALAEVVLEDAVVESLTDTVTGEVGPGHRFPNPDKVVDTALTGDEVEARTVAVDRVEISSK